MRFTPWVLSLCLIGLSQSVLAKTPLEVGEPEAATGIQTVRLVEGKQWLAATANPHASQAAAEQLRNGGSAIDAAIAAQTMLTLTEPQSSGIGGGFFMMFWDAKAKKLHTLDARETAPMSADASQYVEADGKRSTWRQAIVGGRSVGVPGAVQGLWDAHQRWGKLPWKASFQPAIQKSIDGFAVSPRLHKLLAARIHPGFERDGAAADYFYPKGEPLAIGHQLKNPELAESLRLVANYGPAGFYQGQLAKQIVTAVQNDPDYPGRLSLTDMADYQVRWREPLCGDYRQFSVCGMGPPSSGAVTIAQILGILAHQDVASMPVNGLEFVHWFSQASRLAYADRNKFVADPDFNDTPIEQMLDPQYLKSRWQLIDQAKDGGVRRAGISQGIYVSAKAFELPSTSHMVFKDSEGNLVSLTSSIEMGFGSSVMVGGFLLNNQLTDFTLSADSGDITVANRLQGGKRPRSSMAPTIVFDDKGQPILAVGSPGGSRIINYVAQAVIASLDWQLPLDQVMALPRVTNRNDYTALEVDTGLEKLQPQLEQMGHKVRVVPLNSGIQAIQFKDGRWFGSADPRREGLVVAE
ncbi:gamma-glutamyltransferase [Paraferrimonas sedimenticola]|uniref:Glutathione hydrolase proenzyme n=1 Tax=Paraferrimonas sedimenticola TaxID=375674 RepID=A0AA37RRL3_9GAMM|nr:gamma-glutamyltransferase [Paraferrimonas sedimenticola]GLP94815.1 gamma-glutamyltranspeptidase [Paraferrimonas sedimenticola]